MINWQSSKGPNIYVKQGAHWVENAYDFDVFINKPETAIIQYKDELKALARNITKYHNSGNLGVNRITLIKSPNAPIGNIEVLTPFDNNLQISMQVVYLLGELYGQR